MKSFSKASRTTQNLATLWSPWPLAFTEGPQGSVPQTLLCLSFCSATLRGQAPCRLEGHLFCLLLGWLPEWPPPHPPIIQLFRHSHSLLILYPRLWTPRHLYLVIYPQSVLNSHPGLGHCHLCLDNCSCLPDLYPHFLLSLLSPCQLECTF